MTVHAYIAKKPDKLSQEVTSCHGTGICSCNFAVCYDHLHSLATLLGTRVQ